MIDKLFIVLLIITILCCSVCMHVNVVCNSYVDMFISRLLSFPLIMIHVRCKCIHYDNVYCKCNS